MGIMDLMRTQNLLLKKIGTSRRMADIFPWKFRAFWGQDENTSSQEIAKQVRDDMKSLVGQIVYKQRIVLYSFDSLTVSFENRT